MHGKVRVLLDSMTEKLDIYVYCLSAMLLVLVKQYRQTHKKQSNDKTSLQQLEIDDFVRLRIMCLIYAVSKKLAHRFLSFFIQNIFYHCIKNATWLSLASVVQKLPIVPEVD